MPSSLSIGFQCIISDRNQSILEIELNPAGRNIGRVPIIGPVRNNNLPTLIAWWNYPSVFVTCLLLPMSTDGVAGKMLAKRVTFGHRKGD
jgi:hypothetical protein